MDIQTLKKLVKAGLKDGNYSLDTALLQSPRITEIATDYLPNRTLQVVPDPTTPIIEPPDGTSIIVKGIGIDSPFKDLPLEATFYLGTRGEVALTLVAKGDKDWTLDKSFGVFSHNIGASLRFLGGSTPPTLSLLSDAQGKLDIGLSFDGTIDFSMMHVGIATLLGITSEEVKGSIVLQNGASEFVSLALTGLELTGIDLWLAKDLAIQFSVGNYTIHPATNKSKPVPFVQLGTSIPFSSSGNAHSLPITVQVTNWDSDIRFVANISDAINASLEELGRLVGGADLVKTLPQKSSFPIEDVLKLSELYLDIDAKGEAVDDVGLQVVSTSPWTIVHIGSTQKSIVALDVKLDFSVVTPFSNPTPYLNLGGVFELTKHAKLFLSASYPNFEVLGYLTEDSVLNIAEFIEQFVGPCSGIPDLSINCLYFDLLSGDYTFEIEVAGYWPINSGYSLSLIVEQLGFSVEYTSPNLNANFSGTIRVASVDISVTADYTSGDGWLFSGKTGEGQLIPIGEFITYATSTFGIGDPPKWIQNITLQDLKTDFETKTKNFTFAVTGNIAFVAASKLVMEIGFSMVAVENGYTKTKVLSGKFTIGKSIFYLVFSTSPSDTAFTAKWNTDDEKNYLQFEDIATAFGFTPPDIPRDLDLALKSANITYDFTPTNETLVLEAQSANYGKAVFVALKNKTTQKWQFFFGLNIDKPIPLSNLPLIGDLLPKEDTVQITQIRVVIASAVFDDVLATQVNTIITKLGGDYPTIPDNNQQGMPEGLGFSMVVAVGSYQIPLMFGAGQSRDMDVLLNASVQSSHSQSLVLAHNVPSSQVGTATSSDGVIWFNLQKTFGPVAIQKVGVQYKNNKIYVLVNMSLSATGLGIGLLGFGVGSSISNFEPSFEIQGIDVTYSGGGVEISGGLRGSIDPVNFVGELMVNVESFGIAGLAGYTSIEGSPSMFLYAVLNAPLGGPACFFVTGIAGGFGFNRDLQIPDVSGIANFPLIEWAQGESNPPGMNMTGDIGTQVNQVLGRLSSGGIIAPQVGEYWLAAGVKFTSFELANSFALAVVKFGAEFEIDLLGTTTIAIPPAEPVFFAELQLLASFRPSEGFIGISGQLTAQSYVLSPYCHLTGGFAYFFWFSGPQEGNFVITMGGYNPHFPIPTFYPSVPQLGINWNVSDNLVIKGGEYFAVTSAAVMAGGGLSATWSSGGIRAWFNVQADFLMVYQPFHYYLDASVDIGASFRISLIFTHITISIHVGASLEIWGPDFTGKATIDLDIISFTIGFGVSDQRTQTTILWPDFVAKMLPGQTSNRFASSNHTRPALGVNDLPQDTSGIHLNVSSGLIKSLGENPSTLDFVVNAETFELTINTAIPIKEPHATFTGLVKLAPDSNQPTDKNGKTIAPNNAFGVGPTGTDSDSFVPTISIAITLTNDNGKEDQPITLHGVRIFSNVPNSLWQKLTFDSKGNPILNDPLNDTTIPNVVTGYKIVPVVEDPDHTLPINLEYLQYTIDPDIQHFCWSAAYVPTADDFTNQTVEGTILSATAQANRSALLPALHQYIDAITTTVNVNSLTNVSHAGFLAEPVLNLLGEEKKGMEELV